jgi:hypothetical protein
VDSSIGIGDLAAIITAGGAVIYVLGLIGFAVPIYRAFTNDLSTAWYAVSLLPRTVVAGQGVRIWVQYPLGVTILALLGLWLGPMISPLQSEPVEPGTTILGIDIVTLTALSLWVALMVLGIVIVGGLKIRMWRKGWKDTRALLEEFIMLLLPVVGFIIAVGGTTFGAAQALPLAYQILVFFAGSFLVGLPGAIKRTPPLPEVEITEQPGGDTTKGNASPTRGYLVAHSDGFWHLFDQNKALLSIPDERVLQVSAARRVS